MGLAVRPDKNLEQENEQVVGLEVATEDLSCQHSNQS